MTTGSASVDHAPAVWDETARLAALDRYAILDTPDEPDFDDIARLAAATFDAPIAVVNLIADGRQWFKAEVGIGVKELPLEVSLCAHAILQDSTMVVPDTRLDARFVDNPLVTADGGLRFYAGALLKTPDGLPLGTLCVLDRAPRPGGITAHQRLTIDVLARQVMTQLELRRAIAQRTRRAAELAAETQERERAEAAFRDSERRYRTLFGSLDAGFCVAEVAFDAAGTAIDYRYVETNPAFERQTGHVGTAGRWMRGIAPGAAQPWLDVFASVARTGVPLRIEQAGAGSDGRWFDVHAFRTGDPADRLVGILFNDVSDRRSAELALREMNETLDRRVGEIVAEREQMADALRQSQKLEAIGQLTGGVAHDFNNLLTVITGSVELLKRPDLPEDKRMRYIDAIADTAERAARLTAQLLSFARRQALMPQVFDIGASVAEVAVMIRTLAGSRVSVETLVPDEPCFVRADRSQFDTAIVNMAINARDAMDGEGRIVIATAPVSGIPEVRSHPPVAGDFVAVSITDTGSGIRPDDLVRIFEPFFTTKPVGEGTGLGLSQVIGFAKQSDGDIRAESVLGGGTTFTLYLPRVSPAGEVPEMPRGEDRALRGDGVRVLVVEDNTQVGEFATQALTELGYATVLETSGERALERLARDPAAVQILFSDVVMPGMNGLELAREVGRRHPGLPVVLTSGYSHVLVQNGNHGFELLHKPYSVEQLSRVFRKALAARARTT